MLIKNFFSINFNSVSYFLSDAIFLFIYIMLEFERNLIADIFDRIAKKIRKDECELSTDQRRAVLNLIVHEPISKTEAYHLLGISRSQFDTLINNGILPRGKKRFGFNELCWYKDEIYDYKIKKEQEKETDKIWLKEEK